MSRIVITNVQAIILVVAIAAVACAAFYLITSQTQLLEKAKPIMEEPEEILIGTAVSLTGKESVSGTCTRNAYELAIKDVNDKGGIEIRELGRKLPVRLIIYDDESDPEKSTSLIERLIIEDKVDVLLSSMTTPLVEPQTEVAEKHHIPFISGSGAASHIYSKGYRWIFTVCPSIERGAITLMDFIREQQEEGKLPKPLKIAMVWENTSHGKDFQNGVQQRVEDFPGNFEIVLDKSFMWMTTDFTPLLKEVKSADAEVFLSDAHEADFMLMHRQYTELGLSHQLISYGARGSEEIACVELGHAVDYLVSIAWWSKDTPYPQVKDFINKYETTYGKQPEWYAGTPYEAARALLHAIEDAGSLNKAKIRDALSYLDLPNSTVAGQHLSFKENGQADYPLLITQNRPDGTSPIVYPADVATAKASVPRPVVYFFP